MKRAATAQRACIVSMGWTLQDVLAATGGVAAAPHDVVFPAVTTDSRHVEPGALFFALHGPLHDGHDYAIEAVRKGACGVVVDRALPDTGAAAVVRVADTLRALGDLAAWTRRRHAPCVIAVTGSNGKTTTKEMIAAICAAAD